MCPKCPTGYTTIRARFKSAHSSKHKNRRLSGEFQVVEAAKGRRGDPVLHAGANSLFYGEKLLTAANPTSRRDNELFWAPGGRKLLTRKSKSG
uniref:C2H2-type domain-containing protein n=1 Tax=Globodera rostochiensis TaxID=31243 RepID=A0A914GZU2_GLORO